MSSKGLNGFPDITQLFLNLELAKIQVICFQLNLIKIHGILWQAVKSQYMRIFRRNKKGGINRRHKRFACTPQISPRTMRWCPFFTRRTLQNGLKKIPGRRRLSLKNFHGSTLLTRWAIRWFLSVNVKTEDKRDKPKLYTRAQLYADNIERNRNITTERKGQKAFYGAFHLLSVRTFP